MFTYLVLCDGVHWILLGWHLVILLTDWNTWVVTMSWLKTHKVYNNRYSLDGSITSGTSGYNCMAIIRQEYIGSSPYLMSKLTWAPEITYVGDTSAHFPHLPLEIECYWHHLVLHIIILTVRHPENWYKKNNLLERCWKKLVSILSRSWS